MYAFVCVLVTAFSFVSSLVRRGHSDEYNLAKSEKPLEEEQTGSDRVSISISAASG